ncbi:MAG: GNAT family N-acetyltransferase [Heteroscytonema crispum UTEX LB 1556]
MSEFLLPGYCIRRGSTLDRALLVKFMQRTYQDMFPNDDFSHLARTVEQYFSNDTPLWWVEEEDKERGRRVWETRRQGEGATSVGDKEEFACLSPFSPHLPISPFPPNPNASPPKSRSLGRLGSEWGPLAPPPPLSSSPVACLWVGNAIDQVQGDRHAHIFLLYVVPEYRRRGIATALMQYVENWAVARGDRQIGLQVFQSNKPALNLYNQLGYQTQSLWMVKPLHVEK